MSNMDDFNEGVALILERLYGEFPNKIIKLNLGELKKDIDSVKAKNYAATAEFLASEGFIRYSGSIGGGICIANAVLTSKGLSILNSVPESLKETITLGQRVSKVLRSGSKEALNALIKQIISVTIGGSN